MAHDLSEPADQTGTTHKHPNYIVALLASAGGLTPIQAILSALPDNTGAAFFVLQHLAPDSVNLLPNLIKHCTGMPVYSAENGQSIEANNIYVGPPAHFVTILNSQVCLQPIKGLEIRSHAFNTFLESLALDQKERAIAVVLSGACDDGRVGAIIIRQEGGLVIAQEPNTAEFRSMPERIIEISAADIILSPDKIAPMLEALIKDSRQALSLELNSSGYLRIMAILKRSSQVDFSRYKLSTIQRRISRRMLLNKLNDDIEGYLRLLDSSAHEAELLSRDLLIGVSSFFRDPEAFESLKQKFLPELASASESDEFRVWVAGCASGEEAYSYAILCLEFFEHNHPPKAVKILASDINPESIRHANKGLYSSNIKQQMPPQYLKKYFRKEANGYQVSEELKKQVVFFQHDLTEDIPFSNMDLVSCRNVFIYLNAEIQQHVSRCFGFSLKKGGILMISPSETLGSTSNFEIIDERWRIYRLTNKPRFLAGSQPSWRMALDQPQVNSRKTVMGQTRVDDGARERLLQLLAGRYVPLVLVLTLQGEIIYVLGDGSKIMHFPSGEPINDLSRLADPNLRLPISMGLKILVEKSEELCYAQIPVKFGNSEALVDIRMCKLPGNYNQASLVAVLVENVKTSSTSIQAQNNVIDLDRMTRQRISDLEEELYFTKQNLRGVVEELEATNEELQSANEEMQSGNEELQSTNEELLSTNEELLIVNTEFQQKVAELAALNDDITNLMLSAKAITLFVDQNKKIRQASPAAIRMLHLMKHDIGRPIGQIAHQLSQVNLDDLVQAVLSSGQGQEVEDQTSNGNYYIIRANPFLTANDQVSGVTLNLIDITTRRKIAAEKERLAAVVTQSNDAILLQTVEGRIISWNPAAERIYGYTEAEALQLQADKLVPESCREDVKAAISQTFRGENVGIIRSHRVTKDGRLRLVSYTCTLLSDSSQKQQIIATIERDITERGRLEEEERLAAVAFQTMDGIMVTNASSVIVRVNKAFTNITGYREEEVLGQKPSILHSGRQNKNFYKKMWQQIKEKGSWTGDLWNKNKQGAIYPSCMSINAVTNAAGEITHYIGVFRDVSEKKTHEEEIHRLAYYDPLTDLPNRRLFIDDIKQAIAHCKRRNTLGALMFIDLDRFKTINDSLGHGIGDKLLIQVASRLKLALRTEDSIARIGGDEFVIIASEVGNNLREAVTATEKLAQKIFAAFTMPFSIDRHELHTSPSVGVTLFPNLDDTDEDYLRQADNAMYLAKKMGRNNIRFFDPSLQAAADAWLDMEKALRTAIKDNEFMLYYQPQFNAGEGCVAAEALIRWNRPGVGIVPPMDFIPLCEDTGLIQEIGRWVIQEACNQMMQWQNEGTTAVRCVAVNVSAVQFMNPSFESDVLSALEFSSLSAQRLELEVTENLLLENIDEVLAKMTRLKQIGVRFSIDDFGTGYSSLAYIKRLPINKIKIDQTFIRDVLIDKDDACIVESTIAMVNKMGLELISEGVETLEQMRYLQQCGCDHFQGYFYSRPIPAVQFAETITEQNAAIFALLSKPG